jgi:hypothetical protein
LLRYAVILLSRRRLSDMANLFDFDTVVIICVIIVVIMFAAARLGHSNNDHHEDY